MPPSRALLPTLLLMWVTVVVVTVAMSVSTSAAAAPLACPTSNFQTIRTAEGNYSLEDCYFIQYWLRSPVLLVPAGLTKETGEWDVPTHQQYSELLSYRSVHDILSGEEGTELQGSLSWLLRYGPYADELNVLWFKSIEVTLGSVVNLMDGLVLSSCVVQGFAVLIVVLTVLIIMVVKKPLAVPAQQLTTSIVYGSMFLAAVVVVANLFAQHGDLEKAAGVLFLISTSFVVLQSVIDVLISILAAQALVTAFMNRRRRRRVGDLEMDNDGVGIPCNPNPQPEGPQAPLHDNHLQDVLLDYTPPDAVTPPLQLSPAPSDDDDNEDEGIIVETRELTEREQRDALLAELEAIDREVEAAEKKKKSKKRW